MRAGLSAPVAAGKRPEELLALLKSTLEDAKAEDTVIIDLEGKSSVADFLVITSGRSQRHVGAIADQLMRATKAAGFGRGSTEGLPHCDWVLIDLHDIVVHVFRPEVREFYNLEKLWSLDSPGETSGS